MRKRETIGYLMFTIAFGLVAGCGGDGGDGGDADPTADPAVRQCIAASPEVSACVECACTSCLVEIKACDDTAGCAAIRACGARSGCSGADCYGENTCREVIDANGGPFGIGASTALTVGQCADGAGCPCSAS